MEFSAAIWVQKYGASIPDPLIGFLFAAGAIPALIAAIRYERFIKAGGRIKHQIGEHPISFALLCLMLLVVSCSTATTFIRHSRQQARASQGQPEQKPQPSTPSSPAKPSPMPTPSPQASASKVPPTKVPSPPITITGGVKQGGDRDCQQNIIGGNNNTNTCAPTPKVTASAQTQGQTGNPERPWETVFTITSNVLVQTGDLKLKCDGPVLLAGISRINPVELITGSNAPDPNDPSEVVYELGPEMLSPGKIVTIAVYSKQPVKVLSGSIGPNPIIF